jgi:beta-phosphoglucomutase-like phosphatase (HAD superfamily)
MNKLAHYLSAETSAETLRRLAAELGVSEFAQVRNLDYVFSPWEIYPLASRIAPPLDRIAAFAVDMDGTSTTTEPLALHALEYMVRRFTGRMTPAEWPGLDHVLDHPHVIGNSNFRHTEFLVQRYRDHLSPDAFRQAFFEAVAWTLANMTDPQRVRDVTQNARNCGLQGLLNDSNFQKLMKDEKVDNGNGNVARLVAPFVERYGAAFHYDHLSELVSAALDIYYMRYHSILRLIEQGEGDRLSHELLGEAGRRLVEPMPGYDVFVPLIKGWLGPESDALYEMLRAELLAHPALGHTGAQLDAFRPRLARLAERFRRQPAKLALVTASIAYETHAVMKEVVDVMAQRIEGWPVPAECRDRIVGHLADYRRVYDGFVCASDACEPRLKPHRDLYSLALYQMSVPKGEYRYCVGLEDTEPGIISLRAAGIGCAIALPNRDTSRQDYTAAAQVIRGGLPELILGHNLLLAEG